MCPAVARSPPASIHDGRMKVPVVGQSPPAYLGKEYRALTTNGTLPSNEECSIPAEEAAVRSATRKTCIVPTSPSSGPNIAKTRYPDMDPLGKPIQIDGISYRSHMLFLSLAKANSSRINPRNKAVMVLIAFHKHLPQDDENISVAVAYFWPHVGGRCPDPRVLRRRRNSAADSDLNNFEYPRARQIPPDQFSSIPRPWRLNFRPIISIGLLSGRRVMTSCSCPSRSANARDLACASHRRAPPRLHLAISHRSRCAHRRGRLYRRVAWRRHQPAYQPCGAPCLRPFHSGPWCSPWAFDERGLFFGCTPPSKRPPRSRRAPSLRIVLLSHRSGRGTSGRNGRSLQLH